MSPAGTPGCAQPPCLDYPVIRQVLEPVNLALDHEPNESILPGWDACW